MQSACQISAYAHYARTPVLQLKQRTDDFPFCLSESIGRGGVGGGGPQGGSPQKGHAFQNKSNTLACKEIWVDDKQVFIHLFLSSHEIQFFITRDSIYHREHLRNYAGDQIQPNQHMAICFEGMAV